MGTNCYYKFGIANKDGTETGAFSASTDSDHPFTSEDYDIVYDFDRKQFSDILEGDWDYGECGPDEYDLRDLSKEIPHAIFILTQDFCDNDPPVKHVANNGMLRTVVAEVTYPNIKKKLRKAYEAVGELLEKEDA